MPDQVGGAIYSLDLDSGRFHAGAQQSEQDFHKLRAAGDAVSKSSSAVSRELGGIGRTAIALAIGMGGLTFATTAVKSGLESTILAAAQDAALQARLRAAVDATGASYEQYRTQLDAVIKKGEELGFSSEQTRSGLSILIAQTDSVGEAMKRYAIAQDLARGANIDVVTASRLLGKITEDNVSALQRYGIAIKQGATETEALAAVQRKFSGQAQVFGTSPQGQLERTKIAIHDAGVAIGTVLLPGVVAVSEQAAAGAAHVEDLAHALSGLGITGGDTFRSLETGAIALGAALVALKVGELTSGLAQMVAQRVALQRSLAAMSGVSVGTGGAAAGAAGALITGINPVTATIVAATVATVGLDLAARHFTGGGLIDYLTGATEAHKRAAAAAKAQGDTLTNLAQLSKLGISDTNAKLLQQAQITENIAKAERDFNEAVAKLPARSPFDRTIKGQRQMQLEGPTADFNAQLDKAAQNVRDLQLPYVQLANFAAANPLLGSRLAPDLEKAWQLLIQVRGEIGATADTIRNARAEFDKGLKLATDELNRPNPVVEGLKTTLLLLEQERRHLEDIGDTKGIEAIDAQIASLNNRIAETAAPAEIAKQQITAFAAAAYDGAGQAEQAILDAAGGVKGLADQLTKLPTSTIIDIAAHLNMNDVAQVENMLALWKQGITIPIILAATALVGSGAEPSSNIPAGFAHDPSATIIQTVSNTAKAIADAAKAARDAAPNFASSAAAAGKAMSATESDLLALAAAFAAWHAQTGGSIADFKVFLKLQQDRLDLDARLADVQTNLAAATMEAGNSSYQLQLTYVAIAEEAIRSGRTVQQVTRDMFGGILDNARSTLDSILNAPTRESTQMQLQIDLLTRQADILKRGGADASRLGNKSGPQATAADRQLAALEKQIAALQLEQKIRQDDLAIMRDHAILADQTLQTDRQLANADVWLTGVIGNLSGTVVQLNEALGLTVFNANAAADALGRITGASGGTAVPKFDAGISYVPSPMLAQLDPGEAVLTAAENRQRMLGAGVPAGPLATFAYTFHTVDVEAMRREMNHGFDNAVWEMRRRGVLPTKGTFSGR